MKKLITLMLTLIMTLAVSLTGCGQVGSSNDAPDNDSNDVAGNVYSISLFSSPVTQTEEYVAKTITAIITPAEAVNKEVDWQVAWLDNQEGQDAVVTDYVTVTPTSDGALTAEVRCYKAFENSTIAIQVSTRVGKASATCTVNYIGEPSTLDIVANVGDVVLDDAWDATITNLEVGKDYEIDLVFDNVFNNVTANYVPDLAISGVSYGEVNFTNKYYTNTTDDATWVFNREETAIESIPFVNGYWGFTSNVPGLDDDLLTASIRNNKLIISSKLSVEDIDMYATTRGSKIERKYHSLVDSTKLPYVALTITDRNSNLSTTINVRTVKYAESLSVDGNLTF